VPLALILIAAARVFYEIFRGRRQTERVLEG
jgi:hypothetical protein